MLTKAPDGLEIKNQLFLPKDLKPGERRPAIVFVHGGPARQMLLGYHYMQFYHWAYGINQWLADQGYVVLVGELSQRHRLRPLVPHGAEHRRPRQRRVSGRAGRREVSAVAARRRSGPRRHLGALVRRRADRRRRSRATRTSSRPASISRASTSGAARSIPSRCRSSRRSSARSTAGSRRCCSCTETTTATSRSSRPPGSCSCCASATSTTS